MFVSSLITIEMDPVENIATLSNDELDSEEEFLALKHQLHNVESLTEECNRKSVLRLMYLTGV